MITENDYKILKLIQKQRYISKEDIIKAFPDMKDDIDYRLNIVFIPNGLIEEGYRYCENRPLRGYPIGKYVLCPGGKRELELYEEKKKQKDESNNRSKWALRISIASFIASILFGITKNS